ncbi:MAG: L,D-transpeptidase family protein [Paracoccaceae bacterium]
MSAEDMVLGPRGLRLMGETYPCAIGRGGIRSDKREGDGATPRGVHRIIGLLYRPDRMVKPAPWAIPIRIGDLWCDAPDDPAYNSLVRAPFSASHEDLRRADPLYDLVMLTDWNWPEARSGAGSAIFLHQWRRARFPTEGCLAFSRRDIARIAARAVPGTRLIIR